VSPTFAERILILDRALDEGGIGHGFGGAVALAYYVQEPRATRDIDINIASPTEEAEAVLALMPDGIEVSPDAGDVVRRDGQVRLWWDGPTGIPVDLFFPQHEFHRQVERDTGPVPFLDRTIPIISATHLAVFKALFNRGRDWPDIEAMLAAGSVDAEAALGWVARLVGPDSGPFARLETLVEATAPGEGTGRPPVIDWSAFGT